MRLQYRTYGSLLLKLVLIVAEEYHSLNIDIPVLSSLLLIWYRKRKLKLLERHILILAWVYNAARVVFVLTLDTATFFCSIHQEQCQQHTIILQADLKALQELYFWTFSHLFMWHYLLQYHTNDHVFINIARDYGNLIVLSSLNDDLL